MQVKRLQSRLEAAEAAQVQNGMASSTEQEQIAALKSNIADLEKVTAAKQDTSSLLHYCKGSLHNVFPCVKAPIKQLELSNIGHGLCCKVCKESAKRS